MKATVRALLLAVLGITAALGTELADIHPRLLLTPQRLKRIRRDQERQTERWLAFEFQVKTAPGSPERGFELALYYAITGDDVRGREATVWALEHASAVDARRQIALVVDWCSSLLSAQDKASLLRAQDFGPGATGLRDLLFTTIVAGRESDDPLSDHWKPILKQFVDDAAWRRPEELYALCEYLDAAQNVMHTNLRGDATPFFAKLPAAVLLSIKPSVMQHVSWQQRAAALALVNLDPNLVDSQFLQSWAMEEGIAERQGPGVGYELLWGNPYLPGVSYQNLDSWTYDGNGHLFARTDWTEKACWIAIDSKGSASENCPTDWAQQEFRTGKLRLVPLLDKCVAVEHTVITEPTVVWHRRPSSEATFTYNRKVLPGEPDRAGLFLLTTPVSGKVCVQNGK